MLNIVLLEPEMPANTGNIGRTCVATNTRLHLIEPLGFRINDKMLKRAGLDYWDKLDVVVYDNFQDFSSAPVFRGKSLKQIWTKVEVLSIDGCDPDERIHAYL